TGAGYQTCVDKDTGFLLKYVVIGVDSDKSGIVATVVGQPTDADFTTPSTTTTSSESSDTTGSGDTTATTKPAGGGSATTEHCTGETLPNGIRLPPGIALPCAQPG